VDGDGMGRNDIVAEITQTRTKERGEFVGGATIIIGPDGKVRYTVVKRVDNDRRLQRERKYTRGGGAKQLDLRHLHRLPKPRRSRVKSRA
jgi:hypothetical protein